MYKHLISFTCRTGATNTHTKAQRKEAPPLLRPVNRLRHSPCPLSQVHLRPPAAPSVRVSHQQASLGHERGNERGGRERELVCGPTVTRREHTGGPNRNPRGRKAFTKERRREEKRRAEQKSKRREERRRGCAPPVSVLLWSGAPPFAPPRFGLHPPSGSLPKRGVPHSRLRHTARLPIGVRAAPPRLCHTLQRKQAGKIRAPLGTPVVSLREARW